MKSLMAQYCYLQLLDGLTTVAFLRGGLQEGNMVVRALIQTTGSPWSGLLLVKVLALALGIYCAYVRKAQLLHRVNLCYALLITWNLVALIVGSRVATTLL